MSFKLVPGEMFVGGKSRLSLLQVILLSRLPPPAPFCRPLLQCDDIFILLPRSPQMFSFLGFLPWGVRGDVS